MQLASSFEVISVDWPGFGDNPKPEVDWRPEAYAAFLHHLVTNIIPKPFATCAAGHGAIYALAKAAADPGSMGRLLPHRTDLAEAASNYDRQTRCHVSVDRPYC